MTQRAIARVPVDWQVEAQPGANPARVLAPGPRATPACARALPVGFAATTGLSAPPPAARRRRPAPGRVLGLPAGYAPAFPGELRTLSGTRSGVLLAQQTAANLHAAPGDTVDDRPRRRAPPATVTGRRRRRPARAPTRCSSGRRARRARSRRRRRTTSCCCPQAPFAGRRRAAARAASHAGPRRLSHDAARQPERGVHAGLRRARTTSRRRLAGAGPRRRQPRRRAGPARASDALYAQLLFLFLGLPGAILAGAADRVDRRGRAPTAAAATRRCCAPAAPRRAQLVRLALAEAALAGGGRRGRRPRRRAARSAQPAFGTASFGAEHARRASCGRGGAALAGLAHRRRRRSRCPPGATRAR